MILLRGHVTDVLAQVGALDLVATDPPYAFGGSGPEHALTATVAVALRESATRLRRGCWMICFTASSWRGINYVVEATRGVLDPVRVATWTKPEAATKVRTVGWEWNSVAVVALRKGPKNDPRLGGASGLLDSIQHAPIRNGRRAQLPDPVAEWAVRPFAIEGGTMLDPFAGSGTLCRAAAACGMSATGIDQDPELEWGAA